MRSRNDWKSLAVIWLCLAFFAVQASWEGLSYIFGQPETFDTLFREKYEAHLGLVRTHAVASSIALCLGLVPFLPWSRIANVHAWIGRLYALSVIVGGLTALPMALMAEGGLFSRLAFLLQGALWLATIVLAVKSAREHKFSSHRRAMIRNYALTYSAVGSRLLLHGLQAGGLSFTEIYPLLSWTWVMGLAVAEWWIWHEKA